MMKKSILFIIFSSCICAFTGLQAQVVTNTTTLLKSSLEIQSYQKENYSKALILAKQNKWPLTFTNKNNSLATLVGVDVFGLPKYYVTYNNTIAAATTRANQLWPGGSSGLNLNGSSNNMRNKIGVWDGGSPLSTHVELVGRITVKDGAAPIDHSTHVAGTMIATGVNPIAKGMAYGTQGLISYDYTFDASEMAAEASNIVLSNHSYGILAGWNFNTAQNRWEFYGRPNATEDYKFGYYSTDAQTLDSIAYNAPFYLIVKAAGNNRDQNGPAVGQPYYRFDNSGVMSPAGNRPAGISNNDSYDIISWDAGAKNILTVGAVNGVPAGYNGSQDVVMSTFSSWGPTDDGRIKPDIVADGVNVTSSIATSNTSYASFSGTSMATPNTTGSLFLLQEYYSRLKSGTFMRSATLKGLAIHTADEAGPSPGPDYQFGWGLLDVQKAAAVITAAVPSNNSASSQHQLYENVLNNGNTNTFTVVASGTGPLVATICWTDVKGDVDQVNVLNNPAKRLVNDLDMRITQAATTYFPWVLNPASPAAAATKGDNNTDNVERINIDNPLPGQTYTITISHKGTLARGSQAYSLLVSGVGGQNYCTSASTGAAGTRIDSVSFGGSIRHQNTAGCHTYTNLTGIATNVEPLQAIPFFIKLNSCNATQNNKVVKVFIDFNGNGVFTDAGEMVAQSNVINGDGNFSGIINMSNVTPGNALIMRIVAEETSLASDVSSCGTYTIGETQDYLLNVVKPSSDLGIFEVAAPLNNSCANPSQLISVNFQNKGTVDLSSISLRATVTSGATTVYSSTVTYPNTVTAGSAASYTFQAPFNSQAGTNYTITVSATTPGDQNRSNDTVISIITTAAQPTAPLGTGLVCGSNVLLQVTNPDPSASYFWYDAPVATTPIAFGSNTQSNVITANKTYYLSSGMRGKVGLASRAVYPNAGSYQSTGGNYMKYTAQAPVVLESVRLFTRNPGIITIIAADIVSVNGTSYTYSPLGSQTINVYSTSSTPAAGDQPLDPTDTGAVFYVNLPLPAGSHVLIVTMSGASLFRNNNVTGNPYPFSIPNVFSLTGNSATSATDPNFFQNFYYYLYDLNIKTADCLSGLTTVVASTGGAAPTISQTGDTLYSSATTGNQWYLNGTIIPGANDKKYKPVQSGNYSVTVTDGSGCSQSSNVINVTATATVDVNGSQIGLTVSPNPSAGLFNVLFQVNTKDDLTIDVLDMVGQRIYTESHPDFVGRFSKQINIGNVPAGVYILKIQHHNVWYVKKLLIRR